MLTAKEAKTLAKNSDFGLAEFLEEVLDIIEEEAEQGALDCSCLYECSEDVLGKAIAILRSLGYIVSMVELKQQSYDENTKAAQSWMEPALKISWRLA